MEFPYSIHVPTHINLASGGHQPQAPTMRVYQNPAQESTMARAALPGGATGAEQHSPAHSGAPEQQQASGIVLQQMQLYAQ